MAQETQQRVAAIGVAEYNRDLKNCVSLIGRLGGNLEIKQFTNSQVAIGRLAVNNGKDRETGMERDPTWVSIEAWDDLGRIAAAELRKGERIQVMGSMKVREVRGQDGSKREYTKVNVQEINRIPYDEPKGQGWDQSSQFQSDQSSQYQSQQYAASEADQSAGAPWGDEESQLPTATSPVDQKWKHLVDNMNMYFDNRLTKRNPKAPDFKMKGKENDVALWLDDKTPQWAQDALKSIPAPTA